MTILQKLFKMLPSPKNLNWPTGLAAIGLVIGWIIFGAFVLYYFRDWGWGILFVIVALFYLWMIFAK